MARVAGAGWYNAVWRWHFYAGLLTMPFVLWLTVTGTIYLWKPQIEAMLEHRFETIEAVGPRESAGRQVEAALAVVPGGTLAKYQLPQTPHSAARILIRRSDAKTERVWVNPYTAEVMHHVRDDRRLMPMIADLHGKLGTGWTGWGSHVVEIAACWTVTMLLTGLYLWWPRGGRSLAGVLWPRMRGGGRRFWRDLHASVGIWAALLGLFLIATGLPWSAFWGAYFKEVRTITGTLDGPQDWASGSFRKAPAPDHAVHGHGGADAPPTIDLAQLERVRATVAPLGIAPPLLIAPPTAAGEPWRVSSEAADRTRRVDLSVDGSSGAIVSRRDFAQRHWVDRFVGTGIAVHEGALFGVANQLLGTLTALGLATLSLSGFVLWWRRRPEGKLGAPPPVARPRYGPLLVAAICLLGLLMPLFGATLLLVLLIEATLLRHWPAARRWLGLWRAPA